MTKLTAILNAETLAQPLREGGIGMSHPNPLQGAANFVSAMTDMGVGLASLGQALQAADLEYIKDPDTFVHGIGYLIEAVANSVMEHGHYASEGIGRVPDRAP